MALFSSRRTAKQPGAKQSKGSRFWNKLVHPNRTHQRSPSETESKQPPVAQTLSHADTTLSVSTFQTIQTLPPQQSSPAPRQNPVTPTRSQQRSQGQGRLQYSTTPAPPPKDRRPPAPPAPSASAPVVISPVPAPLPRALAKAAAQAPPSAPGKRITLAQNKGSYSWAALMEPPPEVRAPQKSSITPLQSTQLQQLQKPQQPAHSPRRSQQSPLPPQSPSQPAAEPAAAPAEEEEHNPTKPRPPSYEFVSDALPDLHPPKPPKKVELSQSSKNYSWSMLMPKKKKKPPVQQEEETPDIPTRGSSYAWSKLVPSSKKKRLSDLEPNPSQDKIPTPTGNSYSWSKLAGGAETSNAAAPAAPARPDSASEPPTSLPVASVRPGIRELDVIPGGDTDSVDFESVTSFNEASNAPSIAEPTTPITSPGSSVAGGAILNKSVAVTVKAAAVKTPLTVHVEVRFPHSYNFLGASTYSREYASSTELDVTERLFRGLLIRLDHCSRELITRRDSEALQQYSSDMSAAPKPVRYEIVFRLVRQDDFGGSWADKSFVSYQQQRLTANAAREVILATHRMVGLYFLCHDPSFRWSEVPGGEVGGFSFPRPPDSSELVQPVAGDPLPLSCVPRARFLDASQTFEFIPGYVIRFAFESYSRGRIQHEYKQILNIPSTQTTPLNLALADDLLWTASDFVNSGLSARRSALRKHNSSHSLLSAASSQHFEDDTLDVELRIQNNLGPNYEHLTRSIRSKLSLFRDPDALDCEEFVKGVHASLTRARDETDAQLGAQPDFDLRIPTLRGPGWTVDKPARFVLVSSTHYSRRSIAAILDRVQTGIADILRGRDNAVHVVAYKRGHLILDKAMVAHADPTKGPSPPPTEKQIDAIVSALKRRIRQDLDMVCKDTCSLDAIQEDGVIDMSGPAAAPPDEDEAAVEQGDNTVPSSRAAELPDGLALRGSKSAAPPSPTASQRRRVFPLMPGRFVLPTPRTSSPVASTSPVTYEPTSVATAITVVPPSHPPPEQYRLEDADDDEEDEQDNYVPSTPTPIRGHNSRHQSAESEPEPVTVAEFENIPIAYLWPALAGKFPDTVPARTISPPRSPVARVDFSVPPRRAILSTTELARIAAAELELLKSSSEPAPRKSSQTCSQTPATDQPPLPLSPATPTLQPSPMPRPATTSTAVREISLGAGPEPQPPADSESVAVAHTELATDIVPNPATAEPTVAAPTTPILAKAELYVEETKTSANHEWAAHPVPEPLKITRNVSHTTVAVAATAAAATTTTTTTTTQPEPTTSAEPTAKEPEALATTEPATVSVSGVPFELVSAPALVAEHANPEPETKGSPDVFAPATPPRKPVDETEPLSETDQTPTPTGITVEAGIASTVVSTIVATDILSDYSVPSTPSLSCGGENSPRNSLLETPRRVRPLSVAIFKGPDMDVDTHSRQGDEADSEAGSDYVKISQLSDQEIAGARSVATANSKEVVSEPASAKAESKDVSQKHVEISSGEEVFEEGFSRTKPDLDFEEESELAASSEIHASEAQDTFDGKLPAEAAKPAEVVDVAPVLSEAAVVKPEQLEDPVQVTEPVQEPAREPEAELKQEIAEAEREAIQEPQPEPEEPDPSPVQEPVLGVPQPVAVASLLESVEQPLEELSREELSAEIAQASSLFEPANELLFDESDELHYVPAKELEQERATESEAEPAQDSLLEYYYKPTPEPAAQEPQPATALLAPIEESELEPAEETRPEPSRDLGHPAQESKIEAAEEPAPAPEKVKPADPQERPVQEKKEKVSPLSESEVSSVSAPTEPPQKTAEEAATPAPHPREQQPETKAQSPVQKLFIPTLKSEARSIPAVDRSERSTTVIARKATRSRTLSSVNTLDSVVTRDSVDTIRRGREDGTPEPEPEPAEPSPPCVQTAGYVGLHETKKVEVGLRGALTGSHAFDHVTFDLPERDRDPVARTRRSLRHQRSRSAVSINKLSLSRMPKRPRSSSVSTIKPAASLAVEHEREREGLFPRFVTAVASIVSEIIPKSA